MRARAQQLPHTEPRRHVDGLQAWDGTLRSLRMLIARRRAHAGRSAILNQNGRPLNDQRSLACDERKTVELCGEERGGRRCILNRGHEGHHECHTATTVHVWK
jgi:hypothetical protein